jgi:hypothetical protein
MSSSPKHSYAAILVAGITSLALMSMPAAGTPITDGKIGGMPALGLWLDAGQGVTSSGGLVDAWADQSGNGFVVAGSGTARPAHVTSAINGRAAIDFDGSNDFLEDATAPGVFTNASATVFSVFESNTTHPAQQDIFDTGSNNLPSRRLLYQFGGDVTIARDPISTVTVNGSVNGEVLVVTGVYNGSSSRVTLHGGVNNGATATGTIGAQADPSDSPFVVGRRHALDFHFNNGQIAELAIFNSVLNSAQEKVVQNNLSSKYNRPLPAAVDEYAGDTLANGDYDRDVFGIGRADASNIHTSGGMSGFGIEATGGTLDADDEWVLAGHKVGSNSLVPAEGLTVDRWARSWFVDKTGGVDALLTFDFSDAGLTYGAQLPISLIYRATEASNWSIVNALAVPVGDQFTFALSDTQLVDGYYTVAVPEPASMTMLGFAGSMLVGRRLRFSRR